MTFSTKGSGGQLLPLEAVHSGLYLGYKEEVAPARFLVRLDRWTYPTGPLHALENLLTIKHRRHARPLDHEFRRLQIGNFHAVTAFLVLR